MNRKNNQDEFDHFLKETADTHRMFPSEKVWQNIEKEIKAKRTQPAMGLIFLFLLTATSVTWVMKTYPTPDSLIFNNINSTFKADKINEKPQAHIQAENKLNEIYTFSSFKKEKLVQSTKIAATLPELPNKRAVPVFALGLTEKPIHFIEKTNAISNPTQLDAEEYSLPQKMGKIASANATNFSHFNFRSTGNFRLNKINFVLPVSQTSSLATSKKSSLKVKKKMGWQLTMTPTVSYRFISAGTISNNNSALDNVLQNSTVKNYINHKPDVGLQLSVLGKYNLFKNVKITLGLQFNINKYDIKAYHNRSEWATVKLNTSQGTEQNITTITNYRLYGYNNTNWIKNLYYSFSTPIGIDAHFKTKNKNKVIGFTATIQPTKVLENTAFVLSKDLKNYANIPALVRKNNCAVGFGFYTTQNFGNLKIQYGPQFRYQLLSSYINAYSLKENLFDLGIKIAVDLK